MTRLLLTIFMLAVLVFPTFTIPSSATEKCVAVFDFELIDMSLDGQINGSNDKE